MALRGNMRFRISTIDDREDAIWARRHALCTLYEMALESPVVGLDLMEGGRSAETTVNRDQF